MDNEEYRNNSQFYKVVDLVIDEIYSKQDRLINKLRLGYSLCQTDKEKSDLTLSTFKDVKNNLSDCEGNIAQILRELVINGNGFNDESQLISVLTHDFLYTFNIEVYKEFTIEEFEGFNDIYDYFDTSKFDTSQIKKYVEIVPFVGLYDSLKIVSNSNILKSTKVIENQQIQWHGSQTELIELIKSLIENNTLRGKQKEIISRVSKIFGVKINNPDKLIQDIKKRNIGSETLFLDKLKSSLYDFINK